MTFSIALVIAVATGSVATPELCSGFENKIEPDMRMLESDLTRSDAIEAADKLKAMIERGELTGEFQFGALNQAKILYGHVLLSQAVSDRKEFGPHSTESKDSVGSLCTWLGSKGFWYD